jgi:hypothetical protein
MINASDRYDNHGQGYFYIDREGVFVHTFSAEGPEDYERRLRSGNVFPAFEQISKLTGEAREALRVIEQTENGRDVRTSYIQASDTGENSEASNKVDLAV